MDRSHRFVVGCGGPASAGAYKLADPCVVSVPDGRFPRVSRLPLRPACVTESVDGRQVAGDHEHGVSDPDKGSLPVIGLPIVDANAAYEMTTRLIPVGPITAQIEVTFLAADGATADVDDCLDDVTSVWKATSEQDWGRGENNQAGINSSAHRPEP